MNTASIEKRKLGKSDLHITPIVFGAWAIGGWMWGGNDEKDSIGAIHAALDGGINIIDTAAIYGMGHSEELVGRALEGKRDKVLIATKGGMRWNSEEGSDPWPQKDNDGKDVIIRRNAKANSIPYECEMSLKRLRTDVIDLYQIHWPDTTTPVEETVAALEKLRQEGKVRAIGVSNYNLEWLQRAVKVAPLASLQPPYSAVRRKIEAEIIPFCQQHEVGIICYSPLERGLFTGKVDPNRKFAPGDHRAEHPLYTPENRRRILAVLESIKPIADKHHASYTQLMINWTFRQKGITAAIVGARNAEQASHNAQAMSFTLSTDELQKIRSAFDGIAASVK
jgi:aryl-alcohol dehydrogenase-like predicted oxidoreductase